MNEKAEQISDIAGVMKTFGLTYVEHRDVDQNGFGVVITLKREPDIAVPAGPVTIGGKPPSDEDLLMNPYAGLDEGKQYVDDTGKVL